MFNDARSQLNIAKILPHKDYHKEGGIIIHELLEKQTLSSETYFDLLGDEIGEKLLETNVFAYHFASNTVTFQSTMMAQFCKQHSSLWDKAKYKQYPRIT